MWGVAVQARLQEACSVGAAEAAPVQWRWLESSPSWSLALEEAAPLMAPAPSMPALLALALEGCLLPLGASAVVGAAPQ